MIVLDYENSYGFSNAVIRVFDDTYVDDIIDEGEIEVKDFNVLIPTVLDVGPTNQLEYYLPGEVESFVKLHGLPNPLKYGFGPDFIHGILSRGDSNVGVYTINLRGPSATMANIMVAMKYRVEKDVPYTDTDGNQYYKDANGQLTTTPGDGAEAIIRDVLHVKFVSSNLDDCKKWTDVHSALNAMYNESTPDDEGYYTVPWFGILYRGATSYANNIYFSLTPSRAEYDGNMYYRMNMFNGQTMKTSDPIFSFDTFSGVKYETSYYIEKQFNKTYNALRYLTANDSQILVDLISKYLYTVDDYLDGKTDEPSVLFPSVDPFAVEGFAITVDEGSLNHQLIKAFPLRGGTDGDETRDELFRMFFNGEILEDIASPLRYRMNYIPDIDYDNPTKEAIIGLLKKRIRMTTATFMIGGMDGFHSALVDHQARYYETNPNLRQLARCQSPMMMNEFVRRTITYPVTYFDTMAMMDHFAKYGHAYQPFAGAFCRWKGYIEDTMLIPSEKPDFLQSLTTSRINVGMKDRKNGAYLSDQLMNTRRTSDQTELNNAFMISCMLYDLVNLVHENHFKFNEAEEVRQFNNLVDEFINGKYKKHSASLKVQVSRVGTVGWARFRNKLAVTIDLKDINKFTDIDLYLIDE